ncbi:MAG: histidine phosphatase family protein [bacterium]|nr:histidine phosphatase family protein [bacterium]
MLLYILRHGESEGNKDGKFRGRADFPLTEKGLMQADEASLFLLKKEITAVYSSPLKRAYDTAKKTAEKKNLEVVKDESFNNISLGEWEGKPKSEIKERFPKEWDIWTTKPEYLELEGMEKLDSVMKRSVERVNQLSAQEVGDFLIVSHRAVIKPLIAGLIGIGKPYFWRLHIDTAAVSILEKLDKERGWMLKNLNVNHYLRSFDEEKF